MCAVAATPALSVEQYLALPDHDRFELVDGQLVEVTMSKESSWIGGRLHRLLDVHVDANGLGYVWPADNLYRCFPSQPGRIRKPDVSFIRRERTSWDEPDEGVVTIAPDLVAEVVSPNDLAFEVEEKIGDYLDAGTRLVWVVFPRSRMVYVYRADRSGSILRSQDELSGEDVVPGFVCPVSALFPPTNGSTEPPAGASPR